MEPVPTTSVLEPPRKKRKPTHFTESEKNMIVDVFRYVEKSWPTDKYSLKQVMKDKTAYILGISKSAVYRVLKEYNETNTVKPPAKPKRRPTIIDSIDDVDKSGIRRIVNSFYFNGELPTAKKVLRVINEDESLPKMGLTTLNKLVNHLKLKYVRIKTNSVLLDRDDIALWRIKYLESIKTYREQGRPIYYLHEKWVNAGQILDKTSEDRIETSSKPDPLSTDNMKPTSKGNRLIIIHIGDDKGFVPELELMFECKGTGENYRLMNAIKFENWFQTVLPRLEPNAVVVMNNANYHSRFREEIPATNWTKESIHTFEKSDTKVQLLDKIENVKAQYQSYVVDEIAKEVGIEVLRLSPYYCNLNPIDLVWADVKRYVTEKSATDEAADLKMLLLKL